MQEIQETPSPSGGSHPSDTSSVATLPAQLLKDPNEPGASRRFSQPRLDSTEESTSSPVPSRSEKAAYCTGLNDHHQRRSFAEKAVGNEECPEKASAIRNSISMEVTHHRDHFPNLSSQDLVKRKCQRRWSI